MNRSFFFFAFLFGVAASPAFAESIAIEHMHVHLRVGADGDVEATETMRVRFEGVWNGIFRTFSPQETAGLELVRVTDASGAALRVLTDRDAGGLRWRISIPGARDATRVVKLSYRMRSAVSERKPVLHWGVVGPEWEIPIEAVDVRIDLSSRWTFTSSPTHPRLQSVSTAPRTLRLRTRTPHEPGDTLAVRYELRARTGGVPALRWAVLPLLPLLPLVPLLL